MNPAPNFTFYINEKERRYNTLDEKDKKLIDKLNGLKMNHYEARLSEMAAIFGCYDFSPPDLFAAAFALGFLRGKSAQKNASKRREIHA